MGVCASGNSRQIINLPICSRLWIITEFFFGAELAQMIRQNNWVRLPEWTGVWGKRV